MLYDLLGAAAPVPKKDLQNPVRPIAPNGQVSLWRSPTSSPLD